MVYIWYLVVAPLVSMAFGFVTVLAVSGNMGWACRRAINAWRFADPIIKLCVYLTVLIVGVCASIAFAFAA